MHHASWMGAALVVALASACSPTAQAHGAVNPRTSIQAADDAGASKDPKAAVYLRLAREDLAVASHPPESMDPTAPRRALERAAVDAQLALALTRDSKQRAEALDDQRQVEELEARTAQKEKQP